MRFRRKRSSQKAEMDMTPMIDMAFQLIAFFMFAISFSQNEQDERVMLPDSVLAKPANQPLKYPVIASLDTQRGRDLRRAGIAEHGSLAAVPGQ